MLIVLLLFVLLVLGIVLHVVSCKVSWGFDWLYTIGIALTIISALGILFTGLRILSVQIGKQADYQIMQVEYLIINEKLERSRDDGEWVLNGEVGSLEDVYTDIIKYNSKVIYARQYKDNLWLNWFYNDLYADLELIDI